MGSDGECRYGALADLRHLSSGALGGALQVSAFEKCGRRS